MASALCLFCTCVCCAAGASQGGGAFPPRGLVGTWEGPSLFSRHGARETVLVSITIFPDGKVEGTAGGARLSQCRVKKNRGWLGKKLNIKTDYIIRGYLEGAVTSKDTGGERKIAMPFNVRDGRLVGGLAAPAQRWRECCPSWLFIRLGLAKKE